MDNVARFTDISNKIRSLSDRKIRIEERYSNEKAKLEKLLAEIAGKGYDPKNLVALKEQKEAELSKKLNELNSMTEEITKALDTIEAS